MQEYASTSCVFEPSGPMQNPQAWSIHTCTI